MATYPLERGHWSSTALEVARGLESARLDFIEMCDSSGQTVNTSSRGIEPALMGYQLGLVVAVLHDDGYIRQEDGQDFADILWGTVCGTRLDECYEFFERYWMRKLPPARTLVADLTDSLYGGRDLAGLLMLTELEIVLSIDTQFGIHVGFDNETLAVDALNRLRQCTAGIEAVGKRFRDVAKDRGWDS